MLSQQCGQSLLHSPYPSYSESLGYSGYKSKFQIETTFVPTTVRVQDFDNLTQEFYIQQRKANLKRTEVKFCVSWSLSLYTLTK